MKKLLALFFLFATPALATTATTKDHVDMICTYHAAVLSETVASMLNGDEYSVAIVKGMDTFEEMAGERLLNFLEESLMTISEEDTYMIGEVTGMASLFWVAGFNEGVVSGTKSDLFQSSWKACMAGSAETDVASYFWSYKMTLDEIRKPKSSRL